MRTTSCYLLFEVICPIQKLREAHISASKTEEVFVASGLDMEALKGVLAPLTELLKSAGTRLREARAVLWEHLFSIALKLPEDKDADRRQVIAGPLSGLAAGLDDVTEANIFPPLMAWARGCQG